MKRTLIQDPQKVLDEIKAKRAGKRGRVSLYLLKTVVDRFERACGDVSKSKVVEHLMEEFIELSEKQSKSA